MKPVEIKLQLSEETIANIAVMNEAIAQAHQRLAEIGINMQQQIVAAFGQLFPVIEAQRAGAERFSQIVGAAFAIAPPERLSAVELQNRRADLDAYIFNASRDLRDTGYLQVTGRSRPEFTGFVLDEYADLIADQIPIANPGKFRESDRSPCHGCAYFMQGVKVGEPNICNAFHAIDSSASSDCPDYEAVG